LSRFFEKEFKDKKVKNLGIAYFRVLIIVKEFINL